MAQSVRRSIFWSSIGGLLAACVAFAVVLFLANAVLYLLNLLRGTENSWLETAFRELASPAAGAYGAMLIVHKIFKAYSKNFVFFGFSALIIFFVAASLTLMLVVWDSGRFSSYDAIMQGLTAPVAIAAAYYAYKNEMIEQPRSNKVMPIFAESQNFSHERKLNLIKKLVEKRTQSDPVLKKQYAGESVPKVDDIPEIVLMGLPEGTIVSIVETYWMMKRTTIKSDKDILEGIENHRKTLFPESGTVPSPLTLSNYVKYRLSVEHSHSVPLSNKFIEDAIEIANEAYR